MIEMTGTMAHVCLKIYRCKSAIDLLAVVAAFKRGGGHRKASDNPRQTSERLRDLPAIIVVVVVE